MKVSDLKPAEYNPRKIDEKHLSMLEKSMREFGPLDGIIFNRRTGNTVGGHQRVKKLDPDWEIEKEDFSDGLGTVARGFVKTPFGEWPYREVDWDLRREMAANIAANKHGGEWDFPKLKDLFAADELNDGMFDVELTGFDNEEVKDMFDYGLEKKEVELVPYEKTHVLLSFAPEKLLEIQKHLEAILKVPGIEYEQSSN